MKVGLKKADPSRQREKKEQSEEWKEIHRI